MKNHSEWVCLIVLLSWCLPTVSQSHAQNPGIVFSTLLGGSESDGMYQRLAVDQYGNIFTMGITQSNDFPVTPGAYRRTFSYGESMFVTKLNPSGSTILYSTFLDGSRREKPAGFHVDDEGNAYISGTTRSVGYPRTPGSYFSYVFFDPREELNRAFLTKINPSGSALVYSIVFGQEFEGGFSGLDGAGHAYIMGYSYGYGEVETTPGALQEEPAAMFWRPFVCKFSLDGSTLEYATYLGGPVRGPKVECFAVDREGNAYLSGWSASDSDSFPITADCYSSDPVFEPAYRFLSKIDPSGSRLVYSTFFSLFPIALAVDDAENVFIGYESQSFPVTPDAYNRNAFHLCGLCRFSPEGNQLVFSTRTFGDKYPWDFYVQRIGVDSAGRVYMCGNNKGKVPMPTTPDAYDRSFNGGEDDVFFCVFDASGSTLLYATYLGGSGNDSCFDMVVSPSGEAYLSGFTTSPDFPTTEGVVNRTRNGESDAWVCKFSFDSGPVTVEESPRVFHLNPARPNPFNPSTTISFTLPAPGNATLAVYSITGQKVRSLLSGHSTAGAHEVTWDGRDDWGIPVSSGVYLSRLESGGMVATGKMLLVK